MKAALIALMVSSLFALGAPALGAQASAADAWAGSWVGELSVGAITLRIVFNISASGGVLSATMDSPDQGAKGIPVSRVDAQKDTITLEVKAAAGSYAGTLAVDGKSIEGSWKQGGGTFPVLLKKLDGAFTLERPQEPKPPFPYASTEVKVASRKAGIDLAGTLTVPQGKGPFPAVVLVTGSGPQNRDEELMGHRPFAVIADFLSRNGIVVLRCDDRGVAGSKGNFGEATTLDLADDAEAAFAFLAARPEVNPKRVGIAGHSEGGIIAPIVAARNPAVAFIVMIAGPGLRGDRLLLAQGEALARAAGTDEKTIAWSSGLNAKLYAIMAREGDPAANTAAARQVFLEGIDAAPQLSPQEKADAKNNADQIVGQLAAPWYRAFLTLDPAGFISRVRVPVLALNGAKDLQVPADADLAAIETALKAGGNASYRLLKMDGLNHLFQHSGTGLPDEYGKLTETFAPEALSAIRDWILGK